MSDEYTYEWLDDDVEVDPNADDEDEDLAHAQVTGVWRPMVKRKFLIQEKVVTVTECACVHKPEKGKGRKALNGQVPIKDCPECKGKGLLKSTATRPAVVERWARLKPFKPSKSQLTDYIVSRGHKVPYDPVTRKYTTNAAGINILFTKTQDPLYKVILDSRTIGKIRSTYVTGHGWAEREWFRKDHKWVEGALKPWDQQSDRIYTTFTLGPATAQLSSRRPNVQNAPKHVRNKSIGDLPTRWRKIIAARPGHRIWEFDLKSAHALTLGLEAKDKQYMRLARMDVHSFFTSVLATNMGIWPRPIDLSLSDADLIMALKEVRGYRYKCRCSDRTKAEGKIDPGCPGVHFEAEIRDTKAKPAILGVGFGQMGPGLYKRNKEFFTAEKDAIYTVAEFFKTFPLLWAYQENVVAEAHEKGHLVSRGGFIRWFHQVYDFIYDANGKPETKHGSDAEDAKAFRPANTAFVYMRDAQMRLQQMGIADAAIMINCVHDSNVFEPPMLMEWPLGSVAIELPKRTSDDEMAAIIKNVMSAPQPLLGDPDVAPEGLWIECDVMCGPNWGEMKKVKV